MSSSTPDKKIDIFDVKKTPEIYPMTSIHETFEYLHDQMNLIKKSAYEHSAILQRIDKQLQQLSTQVPKPKPAAPTEKEEPGVDDLCAAAPEPEPKAPVAAEKPDVLSMLFRRFSEQRAAAEPVRVPETQPAPAAAQEQESDAEPERQEAEAIHFRRFSEQQLESAAEGGRQPEPDPDSEQDLSPSLRQRAESRQELDLEAALGLDVAPQTPLRAHAPARGLKRLSLCMMPPDEMKDILAAISPDIASMTAPAPSPGDEAEAPDSSPFLR
jgi:hypothetical protein